MNWDALGAIAELAGAVGVIATLAYLSVQIRQNTKTVRASTHQAWTSAVAETNMLLPPNLEFTRVVRTGSQDPGELDPDELAQYTLYMLQVFANYEALHFQFLNGTVDSGYWSSRLDGLRVILRTSGAKYVWSGAGRAFLDPRFREVVEHEVVGATTRPGN